MMVIIIAVAVHLKLVVMISALAVVVRNTRTVVEEQQANGRSEVSFSHVK